MAGLRALALTLTISLLTAGCLSIGGEDGRDDPLDPAAASGVPGEWWNGSVPWGEDHDHADYAQHENLTTANFEVLGYDPLVTEFFGSTTTGMGCGGVAENSDGQRLAVVNSLGSEMAFIVADVTDPTQPKMLGEYAMPNVAVWDATISADGEHALVGAYPLYFAGRDPQAPPVAGTSVDAEGIVTVEGEDHVEVQPTWTDFCTGETREAGPVQYLPLAPSLVMVSLEDPTEPTLEDVSPQPVIGPHSVSSALIDGTVYAMSSVTNLVHEASYYTFYEIIDTPGGSRLAPLTVIQAPGVQSPALNGHIDVEMRKHPITGQVLAYLSNWNDGVAIYDMTEPRVPQQIGHWRHDSPLGGSIHETLTFEDVRDGTHYTLAGQEVGEREELPSGIIYILDTTDPTSPEEVARWTIPVQPRDWPGLMFSTHYLEVVDDTMFVTNYHGGLWAVDITDISTPRAVGHFVPDRASPAPHPDAGGPNVEDVLAAPDGSLTVWDGNGGIYQLAFDADMPSAPAPAWPGLDDV